MFSCWFKSLVNHGKAFEVMMKRNEILFQFTKCHWRAFIAGKMSKVS